VGVEFARHDVIGFTRFFALLGKKQFFWQKKSKTAFSTSTPEKKQWKLVRDAIVAVSSFV
jgi:hypothetical protein